MCTAARAPSPLTAPIAAVTTIATYTYTTTTTTTTTGTTTTTAPLTNHHAHRHRQRIFDQVKQGQIAAMAPVYAARDAHKKKLDEVASIATGREGDYVKGKGEAGGHTGFAAKDQQ